MFYFTFDGVCTCSSSLDFDNIWSCNRKFNYSFYHLYFEFQCLSITFLIAFIRLFSCAHREEMEIAAWAEVLNLFQFLSLKQVTIWHWRFLLKQIKRMTWCWLLKHTLKVYFDTQSSLWQELFNLRTFVIICEWLLLLFSKYTCSKK